MSLSVNQNKNNNYNYGISPRNISELPKSPADIVGSNNIIVNAYDYKENPKTLMAVTIPVWAAVSSAMQIFNKNCATTSKDGKQTSILHNVQDFSENIGQKFDSTKLGKTLDKGSSKLGSFLQNKIILKNKILNAVFNTPAEPKLSMAKMVSRGTIAETAQDAVEAIERYCVNNGKTIEELGLLKDAEFSKIVAEPYKNLNQIKEVLKKIPEQPIEVCRSNGTITKKILSRKVYPSELLNKINTLTGISLRDETKQLSKAGKILPKSFLRTMEGLTNGTAGGKIAIMLQAYSIADAFIRAFQAPKGEKVKTFSEALTYDLSYYLLMPIGMGIMYHAGGTKYTGMTPEQVAKYRKGVKLLNDKVASGNCSKTQYKRVKKLLKNQLKGETKLSLKKDGVVKTIGKSITNIINKPVKAMGKILSTGLEQIAPYTNESTNVAAKILKKFPNKFKGFAGGAMRFGLYMFVIVPPLAKFTTKISHLIFGKPTYSIIDEKVVDDVEPDKVAETVTPKAPKREFEKLFYSDKTNYVDMFKESLHLEKERKELLSTPKIDEESVTEDISVISEEKKVVKTPVYFEETQNGYIPSTKGFVENKVNKPAKESSYIPSTKAVKAVQADLTAAKIAYKNSVLTERLVTKRMDDKFRHRI